MNLAALKTKYKNLKFKIRHTLFVLERKWLCHPFLSRFYPKKSIYRRFLAVLLAFLILVPSVLIFLRPSTASADWFDDSYAYRQKITFTHNADLTDTSMRLTVSNTDTLVTAGKMQTDCDDSRFTDGNGKVLRFKLVSGCNSASTIYDIIFPAVINGTNIAWFYYGYPSAVSANDSSIPAGTTPSGSPSFASEEKAPSPVLHFNFDEGYGTTANNNGTCGASCSGTLTNMASPATGSSGWTDSAKFGKALKFDGVDDYVQVPNFNTPNDFTISVWVKLNELNRIQYITEKEDSTSKIEGSIGVSVDNKFLFFIDDGTNIPQIFSDSTYTTGVWYHVVAVRDTSTDKLYLYVNGTSAATPVTDTTTSSITNSVTRRFGAGSRSPTGRYFNGFLDDIKIYPYARAASQIKTDYASRGSVHGISTSFGDDRSYLSNGLVGWWKMDDGVNNPCASGVDKACDSSGNNNVGTWTNGVVSTSGKFGNSTSYDGTDDYVNIADSPSLYSNAMTIEAWIYDNDITTNKYIISKRSASNDWSLLINGTGNLRWIAWNTNNNAVFDITSNTSIDANKWHHIVSTTDGSSTANLYIDGILRGTSSVVGTINDGSSNITIGSCSGGILPCPSESTRYFKGKIDEVRIYNRALSPSEVTSLYEWAPGPVGWWKMDEGTGTAANDSSGNGNIGIINTPPALQGWTYRVPLTVSNSGSALTDYQASVSANTSTPIAAGKMQSDCDDVRFYDSNNSTQLNYWLESNCNNPATGAVFWVKIPSIPTGSKTIYMYYGNPAATPASSYISTFILGTGNDGPLTVSAANTVVNTYTYLTGNENSGDTSIAVNNGAGFSNGDEILIIQMQDYSAGAAGTYEFKKISSGGGTTTLTFNVPLKNSYASGTFDSATSTVTQVVRIPQYTSVTINSGASITASAWDGYKGGIVVFRASGTVSITGSINVTGKGFRTGIRDGTDNPGYPGESYKGRPTVRSVLKNLGGGGGVNKYSGYAGNGAGGGGYGTAGQNGSKPGTYWDPPGIPEGGATYGTASLSGIYLGSGGGAAYCQNSDGHGSGIIMVYSNNFNNSGGILANGNNATITACEGGGGGGSGGSIYLTADTINTNNNINAGGGAGDTPNYDGYDGDGGNGGVGRIRLSSNSITGTTSPSPYTTGFDTDHNRQYAATEPAVTAGSETAVSFASLWTRGKFGSALQFNGSGDYVNAGTGSSLNFERTDSFSAFAWIKTSGSANRAIISKSESSGTYRGYELVIPASSSVLRVNIFNDNTANNYLRKTGSLNINDNKWHYVGFTYNGTSLASGLKIYVDGVEDTGATIEQDTLSSTIQNNVSLNIGARNATIPFSGAIDDVRIYNYVRIPKQIVSDLNAGHPAVGSPVGSALGHWKFDEGYGTTANNNGSSGSSLNGTLSGSPSWRNEGKFGKALNFNGATAYLDMGNPAPAQITGDLTLSSWVYLSGNTTDQDIIAKRGLSGQWGYRLWVDNSGIPKIDVSSDGNSLATASAAVTLGTNQWYHLLGTYNASQSAITIYVNGVQQGRTTSSVPLSLQNSTANLNIGREAGAVTPNYLNGSLDDVRLYNYALSPSEVKIEYNQGKAAVWGASSTDTDGRTASNSAARAYCPPGNSESNCAPGLDPAPAAHWNLDENTGLSANDISGNGNTGSLTESASPNLITNPGFESGTSPWSFSTNGTGSFSTSTPGYSGTYTARVSITTIPANPNIQLRQTNISLEADTQYRLSFAAYSSWGRNMSVSLLQHVSPYTNYGLSNYVPNLSTSWQTFTTNFTTSGFTGIVSDARLMFYFADYALEGDIYRIDDVKLEKIEPNVPIWSRGKFGSGLKLDGSYDHVVASDSASLSVTGGLTLESWIKPSAVSSEQTIIGKWDETTGTDDRSYRLWINSSNRLNLSVSTNGSTVVTHTGTTTAFAANTWYHVTGVYNSAGTMDIYVNGIRDAAQKTSGVPSSIDDNVSNLYLGAKKNTSGNFDTFFNGTIDDVRIYNYTRAPAQIAWDYNRGKPVAHWKLDDCSGTTAHDASGNRYNQTITAGSATIGTCNTAGSMWGGSAGNSTTNSGKYNYALTLNGSDNYASTSGLAINAGSQTTYAAASWGGWFNPATGVESKTLLEKNREFTLTTDANRNPSCSIWTGGAWSPPATSSTALTLNSWQHILCTYDGTNIKVYLNGMQVGTTAHTASIISLDYTPVTSGHNFGGSAYYSGQIDDLRVYNYALTPPQIRTLYNEDSALRFGPNTGSP